MITVGAPDPETCIYNYHTTSNYNFSRYSNPKLDELLLQQRKLFGQPEQRKVVVKQVLEMLDQEVPAIPTFYSWGFHVVQPWIKGWDNAGDPNFDLSAYNVKNVWIDKK